MHLCTDDSEQVHLVCRFTCMKKSTYEILSVVPKGSIIGDDDARLYKCVYEIKKKE